MSTVQKPKNQQKQHEKGPEPKVKKLSQPDFPLKKENFIIMGAGVVLMIIGYILMSGKENIFSFRKISLSVIFILAGIVVEVFAIMKKPKNKQVEKTN